ncbi:hypothetical protein KCT71_000588 [Listeria monocytogenes]|uniref:DUF6707 family protein n=2 Tax=Listeria monocytogenes TaxID=1639 RepID=UPI0008746693|nr:DUF6707 family protein [Listeria monocytogenes]EAC3448834.1 hypothetical protein [Listeria monocytogenes]EAC7295242.1 hypothetical protein [Listeria monocytogenes]EAC7301776.1 hypothetical protein [Listeria monocytogenes]EAE3602234.1 hypothetical protein [Listeria monocytogenes]EAE3606192.1 hypothetical protein [Listeria monocytogenes]
MLSDIIIIIPNKTAQTKYYNLAKNMSFKSKGDMESLLDLIKILYINDYYEEALLYCRLTNDVKFDNDFDVWTFIHRIWMFEMQILVHFGKKEEAEEIATKIEAHFKIPMKIWNTPEKRYAQYKKNRSRIVLKDLSYKEKINSTPRGESGEFDWKFVALSSLIEPITLNNMTGVSVEEAVEIFRQYSAELEQTKKYGVSL